MQNYTIFLKLQAKIQNNSKYCYHFDTKKPFPYPIRIWKRRNISWSRRVGGAIRGFRNKRVCPSILAQSQFFPLQFFTFSPFPLFNFSPFQLSPFSTQPQQKRSPLFLKRIGGSFWIMNCELWILKEPPQDWLQAIFLSEVEPSTLEAFSLGCLDIEECVVDE